MPAWLESLKVAFYKMIDEDYTPPESHQEEHGMEQFMGTRNPMRVPPHEKPSQISVVIIESPDKEWLPADYIKNDRPVLVDFKKLDEEERDQVRNFLIGIIYALDGTFTRIREDLFFFVPKEVGIITKHDNYEQMMEREFFSGELNPEDFLD